MSSFFLQKVRCTARGCSAAFTDPMGHDLCRAHAHCAISFSREPGQAPYTIWFPEACMLCYELSALLLSEEADDESLREARATLRPWVSGFGRNAPAGAPYLLDGDMASRLFPGSTTAAVPPETAAPLIEVIRETILTEEEVLVTEAEPYLGLDEEPMDEQVGGVELVDPLSPHTPSSTTSFHGFDKPTASPRGPSIPVRPKVKPLRTFKPSALPLSVSPVPGPSKDPDVHIAIPKTVTPKKSKSTKSRASLEDQARGPPLSAAMVRDIVKEQIQQYLQQSRADRGAMTELKDMVASLIRSGTQMPPPSAPDASKLPPFEKNNPWRFALHAPYIDGAITLEGIGTRPLEDLEFYPPGLEFPFNGFVRLKEHALVRLDKVPKETVIFPKEQAQSFWARTLSDWGCTNSKLTPHKGAYTIFTASPGITLPITDKVAALTFQAIKEGSAMPALKETDPTSMLIPSTVTIWDDAPATFTVGKLDPDCASNLFSEKLPKLPDILLKTEFEARNRLARSLHSITSVESLTSLYPTETMFRVFTKNLSLSFQIDLHEFCSARVSCRKHVLSEATIRHEPNRLIASPCWGKNLFPQEEVNKVLQDAARANQNLQVRWGLTAKKRVEGQKQTFFRKKQRFAPYKTSRGHYQQSPIAHSSSQSPTASSPLQPKHPQQVVYLTAPPGTQPNPVWMPSPAYNPSYGPSGPFRGHQRGSYRARGQFRQRGGPRTRGSRGGKEPRFTPSQ
ncbi:uncharacterized protein [Palaemon carinicauda]|uniref:uncharacterized protein n=1 Tax=Palaemon carinicauda TaxID=392227 RepID=UPI0035B62A24